MSKCLCHSLRGWIKQILCSKKLVPQVFVLMLYFFQPPSLSEHFFPTPPLLTQWNPRTLLVPCVLMDSVNASNILFSHQNKMCPAITINLLLHVQNWFVVIINSFKEFILSLSFLYNAFFC